MATENSFMRNGKKYRRIAVNIAGETKRINCGVIAQKAFTSLLAIVNELEGLKAVGGQLDQGLLTRLGKLDPKFRNKLINVGLLKQQQAIPHFSEFSEQYVTNKLDNKELRPRTARVYRGSYNLFIQCVGDLPLDQITSEIIADFKRWRLRDKTSSTVGTDLKRIKGVVDHGIKKSLISQDPFIDIQIPSQKLIQEKADQQELALSHAALENLVNQCPNLEWKVLVSIIRWTGCRLGEVLILRWSDIKWSDDTITMRSPKTESHGKPNRTMPLYSPLRTSLEELRKNSMNEPIHILNDILNLSSKPEFEVTDESGNVIREGRYETNAQTHFRRIMEKAGLDWPQPFHAIRAFRRNELERAACRMADINEWLGHDAKTAARHYSRSGRQDLQKAAKDPNGFCGDIVATVSPRSASDQPAKTSKELRITGKTAIRDNARQYEKVLNTPEGIRTPNPRFRRPVLYPVELRVQI